MSEVLLERLEEIVVIKVSNPPMNVLNAVVLDALYEAFAKVSEDDSIRAVVVAGDGERAFVAGADIREFPTAFENDRVAQDLARHMHKTMDAIAALTKPTIAALHGYVLGGGLELALACDLRLADASVSIGLPEIKLGIFPGAGGTQRLPRLIGTARALEMMYQGEPIEAQYAEHIGLINRVVQQGSVLDAAIELAHKISKHSAPALAIMKQAVIYGIERPLPEGLKLEQELFTHVFQTVDSQEGITAFLEKRKARFLHR